MTRSNLSSGRGVGQDPEVDDPELVVLGLLADDPEPDEPDPEPDELDPDDPDPEDPDADDPDELDPELPPPSLFGAGRESVR